MMYVCVCICYVLYICGCDEVLKFFSFIFFRVVWLTHRDQGKLYAFAVSAKVASVSVPCGL